jgi:putative transposase
MILNYKFRLYPTKEQEEKLLETLELCRQVYNHFLAQWKEKITSRLELQAQLPNLKMENLS